MEIPAGVACPEAYPVSDARFQKMTGDNMAGSSRWSAAKTSAILRAATGNAGIGVRTRAGVPENQDDRAGDGKKEPSAKAGHVRRPLARARSALPVWFAPRRPTPAKHRRLP